MEANQKKGTTTIGVVCRDGIILASEKRATLGFIIATKESEKIYEIDKHMGMTIAGAAADGQSLARMLRVEAKLFKMRYGRPISVEAATTLLSNIMFQYKMFPFIAQIIIGGVEGGGNIRLYSLDPFGSIQVENEYTASGSGTAMAYAILDDGYKKSDVKDCLSLAVKAINSGIKRDIFSGDGVDLASITTDGFKRYKKEEIEKLIEKEKKR